MSIIARGARNRPTKQMVLQLAAKLFVEQGYTATEKQIIGKQLGISTGNINFYYPTKEHLLVAFVEELCDFQWRMIELFELEDKSPLLALCIEFATMAAAAEENEAILDLYISAYTHPLPLALIRENDVKKTQQIFAEFNPDWTDEQFIVMENLYSAIEYGTFSSARQEDISLDMRIASGLDAAMRLYNVPEALRNQKIEKIIAMDYKSLARKILTDFKDYITAVNWQAVEATRQQMIAKANKKK